MATNILQRTYPWKLSLGGHDITLRLMQPSDRDAVLAFAASLPPNDLLFLRLDITQPEVVDEWLRNIEAGRTITILAEIEEKIAGYASIHHNEVLWTRHVGELRVLISPDYRGIGLGKKLTNEAFAIAKEMGLKKIVAQMTTDQRGARQVFERLGFRPEALLADFVIARDDRTRDLLIMSYDVTGFTDSAESRSPRR